MDQASPPTGSEVSSPNYLAHVRRKDDGSFAIHDLEEHLRAVADLADEFAQTISCLELEEEKVGAQI